jgi:ParB/RepB/Spo0J family partition protein
MSKKNADQIDNVRALLAANYKAPSPAKPIIPFEERSRIAEESIEGQSTPLESPSGAVKISIALLDDSIHQNRLAYPEDEIEALAETMRAGQLTPLRVRRKLDGRIEILAGHRRKRAAEFLGWKFIECLVVVRSEKEAAFDVIVENETHQALSDFERAKGYRHLVELGVSQAELGRKIGVNRSLITNRMRFFALPAPVLAAIETHPTCMSHRWVPGLVDILKDRKDLFDLAVSGIEKVAAGKDGGGWTMQTLVNELKKQAAANKNIVDKPVKLSITNNQNQEILTVQRDTKRAGVYEIRITAPHPFSQDVLEQHLVKSLKDAWSGALDS